MHNVVAVSQSLQGFQANYYDNYDKYLKLYIEKIIYTI